MTAWYQCEYNESARKADKTKCSTIFDSQTGCGVVEGEGSQPGLSKKKKICQTKKSPLGPAASPTDHSM